MGIWLPKALSFVAWRHNPTLNLKFPFPPRMVKIWHFPPGWSRFMFLTDLIWIPFLISLIFPPGWSRFGISPPDGQDSGSWWFWSGFPSSFPPKWSRFSSNLLKMPASIFEADGTTWYRRIELSCSHHRSGGSPMFPPYLAIYCVVSRALMPKRSIWNKINNTLGCTWRKSSFKGIKIWEAELICNVDSNSHQWSEGGEGEGGERSWTSAVYKKWRTADDMGKTELGAQPGVIEQQSGKRHQTFCEMA